MDPGSSVLVAEVCHIEADSPNGPRYNPNQTEVARQSFANLIILCSNHHKVIDTDLKTWTVDRLLELKNKHEIGDALPDPPDGLLHALQATVVGSFIATFNQSGGQVAHQIINHGEARRPSFDSQLLEELIALLPSTGAIAFLRDHDFLGAFRPSNVHPIMDFVRNWDNAQHRFVDSELEGLRAEFYRNAADFCSTMAMNSSPNAKGLQAVRADYAYSPESEQQYRREATELNDKADAVVQSHEALLKRAREKLDNLSSAF